MQENPDLPHRNYETCSRGINIFKIRKAVKTDTVPLIDLSRKTIDANYRVFLGNDAVDEFINTGSIDQYVADNILYCSVVMDKERIVGYSVCRDNLIDLIMIDNDFHRRGFGSHLLRHSERELFQTYNEITLESFKGNHNANNFYQKNGWQAKNAFFDNSSGAEKVVFTKHKA